LRKQSIYFSISFGEKYHVTLKRVSVSVNVKYKAHNVSAI